MPKATQLPSGSWRVQVYSHKDENGKRVIESFTAPTEDEALLLAQQFIVAKKKKGNSDKKVRGRNTVPDAVKRYITSKTGVLSPATIRGYRQMEHYFEPLAKTDIRQLSQEGLQSFISKLAGEVSPKTVRNVYGLLTASGKMFVRDWNYNITLPKKVPARNTAPSDADVKKLIDAADGDMRIIITLASFGLRRGEIAALKYGDVTSTGISVHADMVEDENNKFHYKDMPKTDASVRVVRVPPFVVELIGEGPADDFIITRTPNAITHAFTRLRESVGVNIRLHDLRHYFASVAAALGVPDTYAADFGGWRRGSGTLKQVYQGKQEDAAARYADLMAGHLTNVIQHEDSTQGSET